VAKEVVVATNQTSNRILEIGAVLGDSDDVSMEWGEEIGTLSQQCAALAEGLTSPLKVNVVYHVDGTVVGNEFTGVRTGRHFRSKGMLEVQAAIAKDSPAPRRAVLLDSLSRAIDEAVVFAAKKQIATDLPEVRDVAERLGRG
jgi:hypothetical protein